MARPGGYVSRKPIRRLVHTGTGLGNLGVISNTRTFGFQFPRRTLGNYPADCANCLSSADFAIWLQNNSAGMAAYQSMVSTGLWPSGNPGGVGYTVQDPTYGTVTMVVDGQGNIYALVPSGGSTVQNAAVSNLATVTNAPPYVSPTNPPGTTSCTDSVADFLGCIESGGSVLLLAVGGFLLYKLLK